MKWKYRRIMELLDVAITLKTVYAVRNLSEGKFRGITRKVAAM